MQRAIYLSDIYFCPLQGVLPVTFISYELEVIGSSVRLHWSTSEEINNSFFTIQRSMDGQEWENIAFVSGAGNSQGAVQYQHTDRNALSGASYYRIRQTDFDGSFSFTEVLRAEVFKAETDLNLKPNPGNGAVQLSFKGDLESYLNYDISDLQGQIQLSGPINELELFIDTTGIPSGIYLIRVNTRMGYISKKLIIRH